MGARIATPNPNFVIKCCLTQIEAARSLRQDAGTEGACNLQEDDPDSAEKSDKPSVTSSLSEAEQLTGNWWSAKVDYHPQAHLGMQFDMAVGLVAK